MVKNNINTVIINQKHSMCSFKITYDKMEEFSILTIDSKYAKNAPILQFLFRASASNIGGPSYFFC